MVFQVLVAVLTSKKGDSWDWSYTRQNWDYGRHANLQTPQGQTIPEVQAASEFSVKFNPVWARFLLLLTANITSNILKNGTFSFLLSSLAFKPWHETSICLFHKQKVKKQRGQWAYSSSLTCIRSHSQVVAKSGSLRNTFSNWYLLNVGRLKPRGKKTALASEITLAGW